MPAHLLIDGSLHSEPSFRFDIMTSEKYLVHRLLTLAIRAIQPSPENENKIAVPPNFQLLTDLIVCHRSFSNNELCCIQNYEIK